MTYEPPDWHINGLRPSAYDTLMAYRTRSECADLSQSTRRWAAPSPRLRKPGVDVAGTMAPRIIVAPTSSTMMAPGNDSQAASDPTSTR
jgi:hypothetical protein